jgi:hypothetical protein
MGLVMSKFHAEDETYPDNWKTKLFTMTWICQNFMQKITEIQPTEKKTLKKKNLFNKHCECFSA